MRQVDDHIKDKIAEWIKTNASGRENAKPRRLLKAYVIHKLFVDISDRTLRRIYAKMDHVGYACRDPKGIFWIDDAAALRSFHNEQSAKAIGIFARTKQTEIKLGNERQMELPR